MKNTNSIFIVIDLMESIHSRLESDFIFSNLIKLTLNSRLHQIRRPNVRINNRQLSKRIKIFAIEDAHMSKSIHRNRAILLFGIDKSISIYNSINCCLIEFIPIEVIIIIDIIPFIGSIFNISLDIIKAVTFNIIWIIRILLLKLFIREHIIIILIDFLSSFFKRFDISLKTFLVFRIFSRIHLILRSFDLSIKALNHLLSFISLVFKSSKNTTNRDDCT